MIDVKRKFEDALKAFAQSGNRWEGVTGLTYWGAACGMTAEEVVAVAHGVGVHSRDADIRRSMATAEDKIRANAGRFGKRPSGRVSNRPALKMPDKPMPPDRVRELIEAGRDVDTDEALRAMSPAEICTDTDPLALKAMCEMQLVRMFNRADIVRIRRTKDDNMRSVASVNLKSIGDWLAGGVHPVEYGEIVRINPLSGREGLTRDNRQSYDAQSCVAAFRHIVMEFDNLPMDDQRWFWAGFIRESPMAAALACLVDSGGKSIHGVLRVDAPDEATWMRYKSTLLARFASDTDGKYRLDAQAMTPLTGCRLAGARRADTGRIQTLLWACAEWRDLAWFKELNPEPPIVPQGASGRAGRVVGAPAQETPSAGILARPAAAVCDVRYKCAGCRHIDMCKAAFGRFWEEKSSSGVGCNYPFAPQIKF